MATEPDRTRRHLPAAEAQRDRFLFHVTVDYPTREQEREIVARTTSTFEEKLEPVIDGKTIIECQETVRRVPVPDHVLDLSWTLSVWLVLTTQVPFHGLHN